MAAALGVTSAMCLLGHHDANAAGAAPPWEGRAPPGETPSALPETGLVLGLRVAREDWPAARAAVQASPELARWVERQGQYVRAWSSLERERADLVGGWIHDYVDPATGVPLVWTEQVPEPADGTAAAQIRFKQAWVAYVRQRNSSHMLNAARLYRLTGDPAMRDWAIRQLDFYAENYERWPVRTVNGRGRMFRHGLDEAYAAFNLLDAARLLADAAGPLRQRRWNDGLFLPMSINLRTVTSPMTNVAVWHSVALAAIGLHLGDEALVEHAMGGAQGLRATLERGVTADGIWFEGSLGYNQYVIDALSQLLVQASVRGQASRFADVQIAAKRLLLAPLLLRFDDGSLPSPGDVTATMSAVDERSHRLLFRVVPTWYGIHSATRSYNWETLLDPPVSIPNRAPGLPAVATRNFPDIRMAVLRAGDWQVFVHYGQATGHHAQEEALTYELNHGRTAISRDSGTVAYASPFHQRWFRRAASQNVPLVDGQGQQRWARGEVIQFDPSPSQLTVRHAEYRPQVSAERRYQVTSGGFTERTTLKADGRSGQVRRLGTAFHTDCKLEGPASRDGAIGHRDPPRTEATAYWRVETRITPGSEWTGTLLCSTQRYRLKITAADGASLNVFVGDAPARELPSRRAFVYAEVEGREAELVTEILTDP